jgi:hypothetical protein
VAVDDDRGINRIITAVATTTIIIRGEYHHHHELVVRIGMPHQETTIATTD